MGWSWTRSLLPVLMKMTKLSILRDLVGKVGNLRKKALASWPIPLRYIGPWGGPGGNQHWSFKAKVAITEIIISYGKENSSKLADSIKVVDSVSFASINENSKIEYSKKFGSPERGKSNKILFDWSREFLTSLEGTCYYHKGNYGIQSLCFYTNITKYGPFGVLLIHM
ncbi:hypothetical protein EZV62_009622 [Acer yangbiense]|uniref:Jacalin-type lectin domain-containing protein n=1 Tax=Acer yangbiense TaxID=1000413 RepID=A0A5C7I123_9ROSI|nr:hypothetical protein EZV62_009622 [Acer yangbiense]